MSRIAIRPARADELPLLQDIERAAGQPFADIGMTAIAEFEPPSLATLQEYQRDGRAWVAGAPPQAYLLAMWVDGNLHIEQVSVHPAHAGRGIGRALIEHVAASAGTAVTLTTFADVPWNAPTTSGWASAGSTTTSSPRRCAGSGRTRRHTDWTAGPGSS
jgi:ribosomal protein S18 acetylase RimI-like enzyme